MRAKNFIIYVPFLIFVLGSCTDNTAVECNDLLVSFKERADEDFASMNKYLNIALQEKEYDIINHITNTAIDSLNIRIKLLKDSDIPPSGEQFENSVVSYIQSLINASQTYKSYSILSDSLTTVEQLDSIRIIIKKAEIAVDSTLNDLIHKQQEFARTKNLKLEAKK